MEDDRFCLMLLFTFINLMCFLLNIVFLTTTYNIESLLKMLINISKESKSTYHNSYSAIATLFTFDFLGFFIFMIMIMIMMNDHNLGKNIPTRRIQETNHNNGNQYINNK